LSLPDSAAGLMPWCSVPDSAAAIFLFIFLGLSFRFSLFFFSSDCQQFLLRLEILCFSFKWLSETEKNRKLNDLLDALDFKQVVIFMKNSSRAAELNKLLIVSATSHQSASTLK